MPGSDTGFEKPEGRSRCETEVSGTTWKMPLVTWGVVVVFDSRTERMDEGGGKEPRGVASACTGTGGVSGMWDCSEPKATVGMTAEEVVGAAVTSNELVSASPSEAGTSHAAEVTGVGWPVADCHSLRTMSRITVTNSSRERSETQLPEINRLVAVETDGTEGGV